MPRGAASSDASSRARALQRSLVLAFVGVTASFVAASAYSQARLAVVDRAAQGITHAAAPSIEDLADARDQLGELETDLFTELRDVERGRPIDERAILEHRRGLDTAVSRYLAEPTFPGETANWRALIDTTTVLERSVDDEIAALRARDLSAAQHIALVDVREAELRMSAALRDLIAFNARHSAELAAQVENQRDRTMHIAVALNLLCAIAATLAAVAVTRTVRAYGRVVDSRNALLTRRAAELEIFASRVAHDVLNPLGTIALGLGLIAKHSDALDPVAAKAVTRALSGVGRAERIVRDLLAFARSAAKPAPGARADLREVVAGVVEELAADASAAGIEIEASELPDACVACARGVLESILSNLLRNAIRYMEERPRKLVTIRARVRDAHVVVEVEDTGPGIPPALVETIFLPHVRGPTADRAGLGLGLATVQRLVEAHGGVVGVRSTLGEGSVFSFELATCAP